MTIQKTEVISNRDARVLPIGFSMAMSPHPSVFSPLVFAGKLDEGINRLAGAGFDGVEISVRHADDLNPDWLDGRLAETGLVVSAFASGRLCLEESICLCDPRPACRKQVLEELTAIIKLAARFNAPVIIGACAEN